MRLIKRTFLYPNGKKTLQKEVHVLFDQQERELRRTVFDGKQNPGQEIVFEYGDNGLLRRSITIGSTGKIKSMVEYHHNSAGKLTKQRFLNGQHQVIAVREWTYDRQDRITEMKKLGPSGRILLKKMFTYNSNGLMIRERQEDGAGQTILIKDKKYDALQKEIVERIRTGSNYHPHVIKETEYNRDQNVQRILWRDEQGNLQRAESFIYYRSGNLKKERVQDYFADRVFEKEFNPSGRVKREVHRTADRPVSETLYRYDRHERLVEQTKFEISAGTKRRVTTTEWFYKE